MRAKRSETRDVTIRRPARVDPGGPRPPSFFEIALVLFVLALYLFVVALQIALLASGKIVPESWYDKFGVGLLLLAQLFYTAHGLGFFVNVLSTFVKAKRKKPRPPPALDPDNLPVVAVVICSYKEPLDMLEETVICLHNISYARARLYFLDDTRYELPNWNSEERDKYKFAVERLCSEYSINLFRRRWRGAKGGILNDFIDYASGANNPDYTLTPADEEKTYAPPKYILVFDADYKPLPDFLEEMVEIMERRPKLAFIQTPQYYSNGDYNLVARLAGLEQSIFYEYICEGKSNHNSIFCCGTNVLFRIEALRQIGGFDEKNETDDFPTSLRLHLAGWDSDYLNRVLAFGEGPGDLGAYFGQQCRWAIGTTNVFKMTLKAFLKNPFRMAPFVWWEYFVSSSYFFIGWIHFFGCVMLLSYIFFDRPSFIGFTPLIVMYTLPYAIITFAAFFWAMYRRGYRIFEVWIAVVTSLSCFPVLMKATLYAIIGKKTKWNVTPKKDKQCLPLSALSPQILLGSLGIAGGVWALLRAYYDVSDTYGLYFASFWAFFFGFNSLAVLFINQGYDDDKATL